MTTTPTVNASFAEVFAAALGGDACQVRHPVAGTAVLPVERWCAEADAGDRAVLSHCRGRTLDVGCGPGRMGAHLAGQGLVVAGLDLVEAAVQRARERGMVAWVGDVFDPVPGEGSWETALLADGNIGIGGDPVRLLRRLRELVRPGGRVVADVAPYGTGLATTTLSLSTDRQHCSPFPWAVVGADAIGRLAAAAGLAARELHEYAGRWCAVLEV